ncbi:hypothetical protein TUE45_pSRTUE45c_0601 (plasmid) [Streptomyces reticuli]|nr:hypothetical protein TUE45_pSRTUE45c_0601 [Streptomyces reticuli]
MHRKMLKRAEFTGLLPPAVLPGCVVYPAPSQSPLDFLPCAESGKPIPGVLRPGPMPGLAKLEVLALIILAHRTVTCVLASAWSGGLRCAIMITGTALRHTRIGDPVLF